MHKENIIKFFLLFGIIIGTAVLSIEYIVYLKISVQLLIILVFLFTIFVFIEAYLRLQHNIDRQVKGISKILEQIYLMKGMLTNIRIDKQLQTDDLIKNQGLIQEKLENIDKQILLSGDRKSVV